MSRRSLTALWMAAIVGILSACSTQVPLEPAPGSGSQPSVSGGIEVLPPDANEPLPPAIQQAKSRWVPVHWSSLPGLEQDNLPDAWNAWIKSCGRPPAPFAQFCSEVRRMSMATPTEQREWMVSRFQPYRVESLDGNPDGMLTSYFEPMLDGARQPGNGFSIPLYRAPASLGQRKPWYSRQQIETLPQAQAELQDRVIAWVNDPVDAMVLHIQGSGRVRVQEADGSTRLIRVAYAATNDHPYKSIGRWLLDQGLVRDATWPGIKAWIAANPGRVNELLWSNPRYVFFKEEPLSPLDAEFGPNGAQGVPLTPGRSIAVDRASIPYGTPVWLSSTGPTVRLNRLVMAQDTGSAILGAVRADYFAGWGHEAGDFAGRVKQPLRLWVLWPRGMAKR
ncbi:murein transglycosylase A [Comamonas sp. J-3]|uniref:murein transglycosylase A n=1 Tax=Comamonas trifloxystrobinivorans TaxID=3350256 RepID=UPI00372AAEBF